MQETYRGEGVRGFFKGIMSPVMGATPYNAFIFTATETIKQLLGNSYPKMSDEAKSLIAGGVSGGLATLFYNPIELLKVRAQVNRV